jgi:hypothetical protein
MGFVSKVFERGMIFGFKAVFNYNDEHYSLDLTYSEYYSAPSDF